MEIGRSRTLNTDERIDDVVTVLKNIIDALEDVKTNKTSLTKSCNDRGLNMLKVRGLMQSALNAAGKNNVNVSEVSNLKNPYEELYKDIFEISDETYNRVALPYDYQESIHWAMNQELSDIEKDVLDRRYGFTNGETETLAEIGDDIKYSKDRIRQIEAKALRKLRRYSCREVLTLGLEATNLKAENERKLQEINLANINKEFETRKVEESRKHSENLEEIKNGEFKSTRKEICQNALLSSLNLSTRAYNCLSRADIKNVYDFLKYDDISNIRNLGKGTAEEILPIFENFVNEQFGITISELKVLLEEDDRNEAIKNGDYASLCKGVSLEHLYDEGVIERRHLNALKRGGINNLYQFLLDSESRIFSIRNFSKAAYYIVLEKVDKYVRNEFKKDVQELKELLK